MVNREREEALGLALARRAQLYSVFHLAFASEPTAEGLRALYDAPTLEALEFVQELLRRPELQSVAERSLGDTGHDLAFWLDGAIRDAAGCEGHRDDPEFLEELAADYARLLQMPGPDYVHPWESPYVGKESMIFQESTLDVRTFYHEAGLKLGAEKRFPDDHIGAMMDYLGHQALAAYDAFADGNDADAVRLLAVQREFLQKHVLTWVDAFATKMVEHDRGGHYGFLAAAMAAFAHADEAQLGALIAELEG